MDQYAEIAFYYDCEHADFHDDIEFYLTAVDASPILEVGAGTGRVALPLLQSGLEVWGIDSSEAMLEIARRRLSGFPNAHLIHTSISDLRLPMRFPFALLPLNTLWHLISLDAQLRALQTIRGHLLERGTLIIDLSNPLTMADRGANGDMRQRFDRICSDVPVVCISAAWDDEAEQQLALSLTYDELRPDGSVKRARARLELRYTYRGELELLLRLAGFAVQHVYGSYDQQPYASDSPSLIVVAEAT